jgi:hypothetical protein
VLGGSSNTPCYHMCLHRLVLLFVDIWRVPVVRFIVVLSRLVFLGVSICCHRWRSLTLLSLQKFMSGLNASELSSEIFVTTFCLSVLLRVTFTSLAT